MNVDRPPLSDTDVASEIYATEQALCQAAEKAGASWREAGIAPLVVGLEGNLGTGKTTWVRAMLRGLGHTGRVPSPTFTLLEHYELGDLTVVHLDLYRLAEGAELEYLGIRDWLSLPNVWLFAEWPERGGNFQRSIDLRLQFEILPGESRKLTADASTEAGRQALQASFRQDIK